MSKGGWGCESGVFAVGFEAKDSDGWADGFLRRDVDSLFPAFLDGVDADFKA